MIYTILFNLFQLNIALCEPPSDKTNFTKDENRLLSDLITKNYPNNKIINWKILCGLYNREASKLINNNKNMLLYKRSQTVLNQRHKDTKKKKTK